MAGTGEPTVVVSFDRTFGEALAASLSRRGLEASFLHPEDATGTVSGVFVFDASAGDRSQAADLVGLVGEQTTRIVRVGTDLRNDFGHLRIAAAVEITADLEGIAAAVRRGGQTVGRQQPNRSQQTRPGRVVLTNRERELLRELLAGNAVSDISVRWSVSESTVRKHLQNVLGKIGAHTRAEAAAWALRVGLSPAAQVDEATL